MIEKLLSEVENSVKEEFYRQYNIIKNGTLEITPDDEFQKMLLHSISSNTPLRIKYGIDPTSPDVHLGHLVPLRKMRQFQDLGHTAVIIFGDYTASIGDPTGKNESRPPLTREQIDKNVSTYLAQVATVIDQSKAEFHNQTEWFEKVNLKDILLWCGQTTVAKLLSHETFKNRLDDGGSLGLHELFYPILQGIDSVYIKADVELGGSDQKFNVLMGRDYLKARNMRPQAAILLPILTGLCGTAKMSKSLGNYIGVNDAPFDKFGKVMSIPDSLMVEYYRYGLNLSEGEFSQIKEQIETNKIHPNEAKKELARKIVAFFHGEEEGIKMREQFESVFKNKQIPDDTPEYRFNRGVDICTLLVESKCVPTKSEARRMIEQGGVSIVGQDKIENISLKVDEQFVDQVLKVGKRKFIKLK